MSPSPRSLPLSVKYVFVVYLIFCFYIGIFLVFLPWIPWIWENNYFLFQFPLLKGVLLNPFFRGAVSGLGLLNILIGIEEILQYRQWKNERHHR